MTALHGSSLCPVFILDPHFKPRVGALRWNHLIETLVALDASLRARGSALLLLEGTPEQVFQRILDDRVSLLVWEHDTEPYALQRDATIRRLAESRGVDVAVQSGHTLFDMEMLKSKAKGSVPTTLAAFQKLMGSNPVAKPVPTPDKIPPLPAGVDWVVEAESGNPPSGWPQKYSKELESDQKSLIRGGEEEALAKMRAYCSNAKRVTTFEKPKTDPTKQWYSSDAAAIPAGATTALSPYLHFGSLSPRAFYWTLVDLEQKSSKDFTRPPVSLVGQLIWREFFHFVGFVSPNFDKVRECW